MTIEGNTSEIDIATAREMTLLKHFILRKKGAPLSFLAQKPGSGSPLNCVQSDRFSRAIQIYRRWCATTGTMQVRHCYNCAIPHQYPALGNNAMAGDFLDYDLVFIK